ncbi:hypothetical protein ACWGN5_34345 [Streptomyces sp. NPDC055815]
MKRTARALAVAALALVPAVVVPPSAQAQGLEGVGIVSARLSGTHAVVRLEYACPFNGSGFIGAEVQQRHGNALTLGSGGTEVVCDGTTNTIDIDIAPDIGPGYTANWAFVTAFLNSCLGEECDDFRDTARVRIAR